MGKAEAHQRTPHRSTQLWEEGTVSGKVSWRRCYLGVTVHSGSQNAYMLRGGVPCANGWQIAVNKAGSVLAFVKLTF